MPIKSNPIVQSIKKDVYDACDFNFSDFETEKESQEYSACSFKVNDSKVIFRNAKITPTKVGQFVTFWKRLPDALPQTKPSPIQPFDTFDTFDFYVINVQKDDKWGQFVFPKSELIKQGIISTKIKEGKRGFRIYPLWDVPSSKQAVKSQSWQLKYFVYIDLSNIDINRFKKLYTKN